MVEAEGKPDFDGLNATLAAAGVPFKLALVRACDLEFLKKNARFMKNETFRNLVENVKRDKGLSSLPFCWLETATGKYHVLSGNHRAKAALAAGLKEILVLYTDRPLSPEERVAIQLSHNAISGQDDPLLLKELWGEIDALALKHYSGLDDQALGTLEKVKLDPLVKVKLDFRTVAFVFLPEEADKIQQALQHASTQVRSSDVAYLVRLRDFDRLLDSLEKIKKAKKVYSAAVGLNVILSCFDKYGERFLEELEAKK